MPLSLRLRRGKSEEPLSNSKVDSMVSKDTLDISFVVPCYNEAEHVTSALNTLKAVTSARRLRYEIIVMDDGSSDETSAVVQAYQNAHPEFPMTLHRNPTNRGLGWSYFEGAQMAQGEYYMIVNGDGDLPAETILKIVDHRGEADIINPYLANQYDRPLIRRIISYTFTGLVNVLGGHRLHYYNGPVLHRRVNILGVKTRAKGFGYQAELLCYLMRKGCTVVEIPFFSAYRHHQTDAFRLVNIFSVSRSLIRVFLTRFIRRDRSSPR